MRGEVDRDALAAPKLFTGREIGTAALACKIVKCKLKLKPSVDRGPTA
jgi:hypothetical protein